MSYPIFDFSGKHGESCIELHQVCYELFFHDCRPAGETYLTGATQITRIIMDWIQDYE